MLWKWKNRIFHVPFGVLQVSGKAENLANVHFMFLLSGVLISKWRGQNEDSALRGKSWHRVFGVHARWMSPKESWRPFVCIKGKGIEYIEIHGEMSSTEGLLKRWGVRNMMWRCRWGLDFPRYWILGWWLGFHSPSCLDSISIKEEVMQYCDGHFCLLPLVLGF